jgi:hypothetical protein
MPISACKRIVFGVLPLHDRARLQSSRSRRTITYFVDEMIIGFVQHRHSLSDRDARSAICPAPRKARRLRCGPSLHRSSRRM